MELYTSLQDLLRDFADRKLDSESDEPNSLVRLAEFVTEKTGVKVTSNSFWRWSHGTRMSESKLMAMIQTTHIPFEVYKRLNSSLPVLYSLDSRRFAISPFEPDLMRVEVLENRLAAIDKTYGKKLEKYCKIEYLKDNRETGKVGKVRGQRGPNIDDVMEYIEAMFNRGLFPNDMRDIIMEASQALPELNLVVRDNVGYGFHLGHIVTIPLKMMDLETQSDERLMITRDNMAFPPWNGPILLHIFSFFSVHTTFAMFILRDVAYYIDQYIGDKIAGDSNITAYPTTKDGVEMCRKIGMVDVGPPAWNKRRIAEVTPQLYAASVEEVNARLKVRNNA